MSYDAQQDAPQQQLGKIRALVHLLAHDAHTVKADRHGPLLPARNAASTVKSAAHAKPARCLL